MQKMLIPPDFALQLPYKGKAKGYYRFDLTAISVCQAVFHEIGKKY
jgi:hypothetical protein